MYLKLGTPLNLYGTKSCFSYNISICITSSDLSTQNFYDKASTANFVSITWNLAIKFQFWFPEIRNFLNRFLRPDLTQENEIICMFKSAIHLNFLGFQRPKLYLKATFCHKTNFVALYSSWFHTQLIAILVICIKNTRTRCRFYYVVNKFSIFRKHKHFLNIW